MGFVAPDDFYKQVDVVVAPSIWHDPGPLVVADAKAAGRPLLGTRFGGMPEVIEHGRSGWLIPPGGLDELVTGIATLWRDPAQRRHFAQAAVETVRQRFLFDGRMQRMMDLYQGAAAGTLH
jgi:glycosyltransferase involved in cell wall biosynthesis